MLWVASFSTEGQRLIRILKYELLFAFLIGATAQRAGGMPSGGSQAEIDATHLQFSIMDLQVSQARNQGEGQESRSDAVSKLDLKALGKATKEYVKGVRALSKREFNEVVQFNICRMQQ